jgi:hypothetical protein
LPPNTHACPHAAPIVHIGYHKTATTWFQRDVYPRARSHRWVPREAARQALLDPFGLAFEPETARRRLFDHADARPPVICEENFSGYIHNGGLHGLMAPEAARRIKATFGAARVVILIRAQPAAIAASYVQYVRGGGTHGPDRYLFAPQYQIGAKRHRYKAPAFAFEHFEYDRLIGFYDALFGPENVIVRPYEALLADPRAFLDDLAHATGLELETRDIPTKVRNGSFGALTLLAGRLTGLFTSRSVVDKTCLISIPGFYEVRRLLLSGLARLDRASSPTQILGRNLIAEIEKRYEASNRRTATLRDLPLATLGYPIAPHLAADSIEEGEVAALHAGAGDRVHSGPVLEGDVQGVGRIRTG